VWRQYSGSGFKSALRKRELELILERVPEIPRPRVELEQYTIDSRLAATILWIAEFSYSDIYDRLVLDLGCGTARLLIGALILGARYGVGVDIDRTSLNLARDFLADSNLYTKADLICADIEHLPIRVSNATTVQNPPFGVHRKGYDVLFLRMAIEVSNVVYSVHKKSSIDYVLKELEEMDLSTKIVLVDKVMLPPRMPFHIKRMHEVEIAVVRVEKEGEYGGYSYTR